MIRPLAAVLLLCSSAPGMTLREALANPKFAVSVHGDGRGELTVQLTNKSAAKVAVEIPTGLIAIAPSGARLAAIRTATLDLPAGQTAEASLPAVPLSLANRSEAETYRASSDELPALRPLLDYSAKTNDLPRPTAQLTALLLLEDVTFAKWREFLGHEPDPKEVATAVDALALAKQLAPDKSFALAQDADLRLRALRQPLVRAKAMQLFGIAAPEGVPVPDVQQLLHTRPGDNCPICRMRAQMEQQPGNGL
jgi:hypothetical protein